ncbi:MAG: hypothetical protein IJE07_12395 [Clostridia bacterium]|nr:hypothetical protein [Clostridia bacterium]
MAPMMQWQSLLGLPLADALERARAAGVEAEVTMSCAPRRNPVSTATERVIRVSGAAACLRLTVSAFCDGDPEK